MNICQRLIVFSLLKRKNSIYSNFVKPKNKILKEFFNNIYKNDRNLLSTLLKGLKKSILQTSLIKTSKIQEESERYKNFGINEAKKQMTDLH